MKGDFTRRTFRERNHYRSVLMQQGRVQLDADWNEQAEIQDHLDRTTTRDTIGRHGAPIGCAGMEIVCSTGDVTTGCAGADLRISAGRYYVDGILCENDADVPLVAQPDLPRVKLPDDAGRYVAYLDVWAEHVTALERPELREVALGGPDTATRSRTIWQVRLCREDRETCPAPDEEWTPPEGTGEPGQLRARAQAPQTDEGPCVVPATAGYRRLENQLYRVEIRDGSPPLRQEGGALTDDHYGYPSPDVEDAADAPADVPAEKAYDSPAADDESSAVTFVWSRENGSVTARLVDIQGPTLIIAAPGRDTDLGFAKNDWVEAISSDHTRRGEPGLLVQLEEATGTKLTVRGWDEGAPTLDSLGADPVVRRWDSDGAVTLVVPTDPGQWTDLEDGVQVQFEAGSFRTGDYWLIPARSANLTGEVVDPALAGDVEWPRDDGEPLFRPPVGIEHHYAPLALLDRVDGRWTRCADCRNLFPPLGGLLDMEYAGGDGQETLPGQPLPQPLEVSVTDGARPVAGVAVRFEAADADGRLAEEAEQLPDSTAWAITATTDSDGVASCYWRPVGDPARPSQRVTASLVGSDGKAHGSPIRFSASLSLADRVWFEAGDCGGLTDVTTVQGALDQLVTARSVAVVGGNGQSGAPGSDLPLPAEVLVRTDCGPVAGAEVRFTVASGAVAAETADLGTATTTVDLTTGADGVAPCWWRLGADEQVQPLVAELLPDDAPVEQPTTVAFTASLERGRDDWPGLRVTDVVTLGEPPQPLLNDGMITGETLTLGVGVVLDGSPLPATVNGKPVLTVTADLPYPFSDSDRNLWFPDGDADVIGTTPLTLAGNVALGQVGDDPAITWTPTDGSAHFLPRLLGKMSELDRGDRVLCHLTLTGRAVADSADGDRRVVNGLALGRPGSANRTDLELPTVDHVHGADFTLWFWLVTEVTDLVVVPTRAGLLRRKTVRDAIDLSLPRDEMRARLTAGVRVLHGREPDLGAAERAAALGFRNGNGNGRRLVVVVDERYAEAAAIARDGLQQAGVELELIPTTDLVAAVQARTAADQQLDGVVTDDASIRPLTDLGGFTKAIRL
ncbi:hypothetical protein GCM10027451_16000 [Geodermatophilus aquaeductus]|uniref:Big-1 domain-containing protein n=1 Tax=Geodermatophilus aquaeductus TaxID=1564161 RepID=A0A521DYK0_9ACTN|nr:DUF6519 domain-containing protein [Geodermatophilus aquaeductus]SMO76692.1 hypothetical protein SAMN06273567_10419 [Geodermatophilus aquaeductus]